MAATNRYLAEKHCKKFCTSPWERPQPTCVTYRIFLGGSANATASCSKCPLCEPSQNGLFLESPQRQIETMSLPARSYGMPFLSTISKSPSTFREPLLFTVIFVVAIVF